MPVEIHLASIRKNDFGTECHLLSPGTSRSVQKRRRRTCPVPKTEARNIVPHRGYSMTSSQVRQSFSIPRIHMGAIGTTELTTIAAKTDPFRFFGESV
jgi:hypothetical protein